MKTTTTTIGIAVLVLAGSGDRSPAPHVPTGRARAGRGAIAFRMIGDEPFVTVALNGTTTAEFELVADGVPCAVRRELAEQLWPADQARTEGFAARAATFTIGDTVVRDVACAVGATNAIALSRLGLAATFDYPARELQLQPGWSGR